MVNEILTAAGITYRKCRFLKPPAGSYAVYTDDVETDGPDGMPMILHHRITAELYERTPDTAAEEAIENAITAAGLQWEKQDRFWIPEEQLYQVIYEFDYFEKKRSV